MSVAFVAEAVTVTYAELKGLTYFAVFLIVVAPKHLHFGIYIILFKIFSSHSPFYYSIALYTQIWNVMQVGYVIFEYPFHCSKVAIVKYLM